MKNYASSGIQELLIVFWEFVFKEFRVLLVKGRRGKRLMRRRGEMLERPFAHLLESGAMRRVFLRGRENIEKRYQLHAAAYNLGLLIRSILGAGTPRRLRGLHGVIEAACRVAQRRVSAIWLRRIDELRRFMLTTYSLAGVEMPRETATSATRC